MNRRRKDLAPVEREIRRAHDPEPHRHGGEVRELEAPAGAARRARPSGVERSDESSAATLVDDDDRVVDRLAVDVEDTAFEPLRRAETERNADASRVSALDAARAR